MTATPTIPSANDSVRALAWFDEGLSVLDQRALPGTIRYDVCTTSETVAEAISTMRVRGAPAIGIAAAYGVVLAGRTRFAENPATWKSAIAIDLARLAESRPTAVNLFWALNRMRREIETVSGDPFPSLLGAALAIHEEDIAANRRLGEFGAGLLEGATGVLTHCNTGSLATGGYGTALGIIRSAYRRSPRKIYATETRPWLQGSRLTVWELEQDAIPATLIADSAAAYLMKSGAVQWVIVGADRIAANGDTANKIGTYGLAVAARHHRVRFMVAAPGSTIDWRTPSGEGIEIENRDPRELLNEHFIREDGIIDAWNPVFDVTPAVLIDAIVTEKGVVRNPGPESMQALRESP